MSDTLKALCAAVGAPYEEIEQIARDHEDGTPGWRAVFDVDEAPAKWLRWLGQFGGVPVPVGMGEAQARTHIKQVGGQARGTVGALVAAIQEHLNDPKTVIVRARDPDADSMIVRVYTSQVVDAALAEAAARREKRAFLALDFAVIPGWDYQQLETTYLGQDYADLAGDFATYNLLADNE